MTQKYIVKTQESHKVDYIVDAASKEEAMQRILSKDVDVIRCRVLLCKTTHPINLDILSIQTDAEAHQEEFDKLKLPPWGNTIR